MTSQITVEPISSLPLSGLRVVEFCHIIMGPTVGLVLAELGAEVIKVEPLPRGEATREVKGHIAGSFGFYNRDKKSIGVDIKSEAGQEVVRRLVDRADIVTENFAPGTADRIGIGYDALSTRNGRLIYCSLKGFLPGPYEKRAGLDELAQYMTGLAFMTGPVGQPLRAGTSLVDIGGGLFGVIGILAALHQRQQTGKGQRVQSALYETGAFFAGQHMAGETVTGRSSIPYPARGRSWAIYEIFRSSDGKDVFIGVTSDKQWELFCTAFGRTDLIRPDLDSNEKRRKAYPELQPVVAEIASRHSADDLVEKLVALGCPVGIAAKPGDLFEDPQLNFDNRMSCTKLSNGETVNLPRLPILMSGTTRSDVPGGQVPSFGDHTVEVLNSIGFSELEVEEMRQRCEVS